MTDAKDANLDRPHHEDQPSADADRPSSPERIETRPVREEESYTRVRRVEGGSGLIGCVGLLGVVMALLAAPMILYACLDLIWTDDNEYAYRWLLTGAVVFVVGVATVAVSRMAR